MDDVLYEQCEFSKSHPGGLVDSYSGWQTQVKIPPGTRPDLFRLEGKGLQAWRVQRGDEPCPVNVDVPWNLRKGNESFFKNSLHEIGDKS